MLNHPDRSDDSDTSFEDESRLFESHSLRPLNGPQRRGEKAGAKRGRYNRVVADAKKPGRPGLLLGWRWSSHNQKTYKPSG